MPHSKVTKIPIGLPVTEDRARELASAIAERIDDDVIDALIELLLGVAPACVNLRDFPELSMKDFNNDLFCRKLAAQHAIAAFFETSEAFADAFGRYAEQYMPKQTRRTMEEVLGFESSVARKLISKHAPAKAQSVPTESKQGRGKR